MLMGIIITLWRQMTVCVGAGDLGKGAVFMMEFHARWYHDYLIVFGSNGTDSVI